MKKLTILLSVFLLSSCFIYSAEDDCIYGLVQNQCFGEEYTYIAEYQKIQTLGHTDSKQRWKDISACGGKKDDVTLQSVWGGGRYNKETEDRLWEKFQLCMIEKGYVRINKCGRRNSTTDKGICNE